jgi:hypothetical protein
MRYTAVIGDLIGSKALERDVRRTIQRNLKAHFRNLQPTSTAGLASQPTITLGDEFQALFSAADHAADVLTFLTEVQDLCRPIDVRFGIGVGSLSTDLTPVAIGMDGPCFHHAREALEVSHDQELACRVRGGDPLVADMLTFLVSQLLRIRRRWSDEQREAIETYLDLPEKERSWSRVAEELRRSPSAITQRQQGAQWKLVRALSDVVERGLSRLEAETEEQPS